MKQGVVWALFNGSDIAVKPWADAGYLCLCFNAEGADHGSYAEVVEEHPNIQYIDYWIDPWFPQETLGMYPAPNFILSFPPCTHLAVSGAAHFKKKLQKDPLIQVNAVKDARIAETLGNMYNCPWHVENPVGVMSSMWRKPDYRFHPSEYGGYLPEDDQNPWFPDLIQPRDAYPKLTCGWIGNGFIIPEKRPVPQICDTNGYSFQHTKLGGKSPRTKMIRSLTPRGWALAVFEANEPVVRSKLNG
nr:MAG TPA: Cytosine specific methyltransferase [Caudoviricetes sp.]